MLFYVIFLAISKVEGTYKIKRAPTLPHQMQKWKTDSNALKNMNYHIQTGAEQETM